MSADNQNQTPPKTDETTDKSTGNQDALNAQFAEVQEQLRAMNAQMQAIADANKKPVQTQERNLYDPEQLLQAANEAADRKYREERDKDVKIYNLAQDYPEIQTDPKVRQAVVDAQKDIPEALRNTAIGYEMAVLKATSRAGLIPKSKRQTVDADVSLEPRRSIGDPRNKTKVKVSRETLEIAELFGRDINDPKVLASLEEAANRADYTKYR